MIKESTMENTKLLDSWKTMKLVDVCIVERGSSPRPIKKYITDDENGVNWIKIGDTKNIEKYIYETNQKITKEGAEKSRFVAEGDFILSNSMSFGKPYIMKTQGYIHDGWFRLKLHDFVDTEYFYQLLSSPLVNDQFHNLASGSVVKNISGDLVKKVILPIPPLSQQKQIVAILDKAFAAIDTAKANAGQNLQNAKELFESYLQNVFENKGDDWEEKTITEVTKIVAGGTPKTGIKEYWGGDIAWITPADMGKLRTREVSLTRRTITNNGLQKSSAKLFPENSVILSSRAPIGHLAINTVPMSTNQGCRGVVPKKYLDTIFLYYFLKGNISLLNDLGTGATFKELSTKALGSVIIPLPSLSQQKKIVQKLDGLFKETKKLEAIYTQKLADLEEMKKSVLQKAFSGQLNTIN
jgi:type I restriction enzyme S subunit